MGLAPRRARVAPPRARSGRRGPTLRSGVRRLGYIRRSRGRSRARARPGRGRGPLARSLHGAARVRSDPDRPHDPARRDDSFPRRAFRRVVGELGLRGGRARRCLLPRRPRPLAAQAQSRERGERSKALSEPWPLDGWPDAPTKYLLCSDDRMFTPEWSREHARQRLGIEADETPGGHYVTLSRPVELAARLDGYGQALT